MYENQVNFYIQAKRSYLTSLEVLWFCSPLLFFQIISLVSLEIFVLKNEKSSYLIRSESSLTALLIRWQANTLSSVESILGAELKEKY